MHYFEECQEIISLTSSLMRIRSTADKPDELVRCADYIQLWCSHYGITCERFVHNGIPSLYIGTRSRKGSLLIMAHFDVVDGEDSLFTPRHEGNILWGRGSIDDKYAVAMSLILFRNHLQKQQSLGKTQDDMPFQLLFTGDEESGGYNGAHQVLPLLNTDFCIAIDGGNPQTIITKGKGIIDCTLTCTGKAAHGARPWLGINAVDVLMQDYQALKTLFRAQEQQDDVHWHRTLNLGKMQAGTAINQVPNTATAWLDIRYTEEDNPEELLTLMRSCIQGTLAVIALEPLLYTPANPWIDRLLQYAPEASLGQAHGASDARFLSPYGIPCVVWGAEGENSQHGACEHLCIDSILSLYSSMDAFISSLFTSQHTIEKIL